MALVASLAHLKPRLSSVEQVKFMRRSERAGDKNEQPP
jgi:hypothetical protein